LGVVPDIFKLGFIAPLLKKADLDPAAVISYRPISNLPVLLKLLKRLVARQMHDHLVEGCLLPDTQSACRAYQSKEAAVLKVLVGHIAGGGWG